ncbi:hypothetical protein ACROYT_G030673 [Oculina patagonica]
MQISAYAGIATVAFVAIYLLAKKLQEKNNMRHTKPGTVVLHQFVLSKLSVSGSPPCIKLETFLRMTKIPYENNYSFKFSKKGKKPWIEFNGQEIADSNFCIEFLKKEFQVDIDSHLSATEKAIAHSIRTMLEENTYCYVRGTLFGPLILPLRYLIFYMVQRQARRDLWSHGIGRHSEQDVYGIAEKDLLAVSAILDQKKFLFGEKPCLADVAVFAYIAASWDCPQRFVAELTKSKAENLEKHAQRMKEMYFPDWNDIISRRKHKSD